MPRRVGGVNRDAPQRRPRLAPRRRHAAVSPQRARATHAEPHRSAQSARAASTPRSRSGGSAVVRVPRQRRARQLAPSSSSALSPSFPSRCVLPFRAAASMSSRSARGALAAAQRLLLASRATATAAHCAPPLALPVLRRDGVAWLCPAGGAAFHAAAPAFEARARRGATRVRRLTPPPAAGQPAVAAVAGDDATQAGAFADGGNSRSIAPLAAALGAEVALPCVGASLPRGAGAEQPGVPG